MHFLKNIIIFFITVFCSLAIHGKKDEITKNFIFDSWNVKEIKLKHKHVISMIAHPVQKNGNYKKRDIPFIAISCWLKHDLHGDVSMYLGYPIAPRTKVTATVYKRGLNGWRRSFYLIPYDESAWFSPEDSAREQRFIDSIKSGDFIEVKAKSKRGTHSKDLYSLKGSLKAYKKLNEIMLQHS